jgi:carbon monoxide dehydrogenase subunit G
MAMTMTGAVVLPADRMTVWDMLNDPDVLGRCIPGCEAIERVGDNGFRATARVAVGPVKARFKGLVALTDMDPPSAYTISGEGEGGAAGFARGSARVRLAEVPDGTELTYEVEAAIGGRLAQLGGRLINSVAKRQADEFFEKFKAIVAGSDAAGSKLAERA